MVGDMGTDATRARPWWRIRLGLTAQLGVALVIVVLTLVLTLGGIALWSLGRTLRRDARQRADTTADLAATLVENAVTSRAAAGARLRQRRVITRLRHLKEQAGAEELLVVLADGERIHLGDAGLPIQPERDPGLAAALAGHPPETRSRAAPAGQGSTDDRVVAYRSTRLRGSRHRAAVRVVLIPAAQVEARLGPTRTLLIGLAVVDGLLVFGFGLLFLRRRVLGPLRDLEQATARVAAGDQQTRLPTDEDGDFGRVAERFNDMLERLRAKDQRLKDQVLELQTKQRELDQSWEVLLRSAKLASVGRLTAGVAHELGNPMSSILGYLELLSDPEAPEDKRLAWIERVRAEIQRMDRTIRALLETARPGDDSVVATDLGRVIRQAAELVKHQKRLREVDVRLQLPELPAVAASARLSQVFVNLLLNAGDALQGPGEVRVTAERDGDRVRVIVRDDGPGIPAEIRDALFDPFVTTKAPGEGTGLGLAISQTILEASGGRLRLTDPQPDTGASLELELRIWDD